MRLPAQREGGADEREPDLHEGREPQDDRARHGRAHVLLEQSPLRGDRDVRVDVGGGNRRQHDAPDAEPPRGVDEAVLTLGEPGRVVARAGSGDVRRDDQGVDPGEQRVEFGGPGEVRLHHLDRLEADGPVGRAHRPPHRVPVGDEGAAAGRSQLSVRTHHENVHPRPPHPAPNSPMLRRHAPLASGDEGQAQAGA